MAIRKARLERSPLSYEQELLLSSISDQITAAIENHQDCVSVPIGSQMNPIMTRDSVELIKDHCKANEFKVKVMTDFMDKRSIIIYGW